MLRSKKVHEVILVFLKIKLFYEVMFSCDEVMFVPCDKHGNNIFFS